MDTALLLKKRLRTERLPLKDIQDLLNRSEIVEKLLHQAARTDTFTGLRKIEFRLIELSEIPHALTLAKAQALLAQFIAAVDVKDGFSLTGKSEGVLACHQGIITLIFIRAGRQVLADQGIEWILKYQITERDEKCPWTGKDLFSRFGGCVGHTPCYDGLVKNMMALSAYQKTFGWRADIQEKLDSGLSYILAHRGIYQLENDNLLNDDIGKLFYPYPYRTNVLEILTLMKNENLFDNPALKQARAYLASQSIQVEKIFMPTSWTAFDPVKQQGDWLCDIVSGLLY
jgi:hypothetical protein